MKKPSFVQIGQFLQQKKQQGTIIYPEGNTIFNAFTQTPFDQVKVVLLGQDPYHGEGQAHGLCFSVQDGMKPPPSLMNIYKELATDIGKEIPVSGNLLHWAQQGVLMLNVSLSVEANAPMSHSKIGWEQFTDAVIKKVSDDKNGIVFILWGQFAQAKEKLIDSSRHTMLKAAHPSPLSAYKGFFGCKHFSKTNAILQAQGKKEIDW
jgi:uracil-DNA glycosylase